MLKYQILVFLLGIASVRCLAQANTNPQLIPKQQSLVKIASNTAVGNIPQLEQALVEGLEAGLTVNEIKEAIVHLYAYCGFPRSIMGLRTFLSVLDTRQKLGIKENWGPVATPIADTVDKYTRGVTVLETLIQAKLGPKPAYQQFAPEMDTLLKEHLFADIFERDVLTYAERELVTISVISTLGGLDPMLRAHFNICLKTGITPEQLTQALEIIRTEIGKEKADAAHKTLYSLIEND